MNPVPVMPLIELVVGLQTDENTIKITKEVAT